MRMCYIGRTMKFMRKHHPRQYSYLVRWLPRAFDFAQRQILVCPENSTYWMMEKGIIQCIMKAGDNALSLSVVSVWNRIEWEGARR